MPDGSTWRPLPRDAEPTKPAKYRGDDFRDLIRHCDQRLTEMRTYRSSHFATWRELSQYIMPQRGRFVMPPAMNPGNRGAQKQQSIVDRTATKAVKDLASFLMAGITSPARNWFRLTVQDQDLADLPEVKLWLDEVQKRMMRVFAVSNFYNAMASLYEELAVFGTGVMLIVQDYEDVIRCYPLTAGEYMLAVDERLIVNTLYREYVLTVEQMVREFGLENCSDAVQSLYRANQLGREVQIVHAIEPNHMRVPGRMGWRGMPFLSVWYEYGRRADQALRVSGFHEFPAIAPRWDVVTTEVYGHGPAEEALPDVKTLQLLQRRKAEAVDKIVKPPLVGDASLQNSIVSLLPGGLNFVPGGSTAGLKPVYQVPPNIQGLQESIQETRELIRQAFRADLFAMFAGSDRREMTAREVDERHEEKLLMLGPMLERLHDEGLNPIIDITFNIMARGRLLPPIPEALAGKHIVPDYISLLAQAQKAVGTTAIEGVVGFLGRLASVKPEVLDKINEDEALNVYASLLGVDAKLVRSEDEVAAIRDARAKQAQMAQAAQMAGVVAQGAKVLSETDIGSGQNALSLMLGR